MNRKLDFTRPIIMGILNVTPDSFSDGGSYPSSQAAVDKAMVMIEQGASIIDIGGESTRPGSERVPPIEQKRRIIDVISQLKKNIPESIVISVDTTSSVVARAAVELGVDMINDVSGGTDDEEMIPLVVKNNLYYCIMHMQGDPETMQLDPHYHDLIEDIKSFFAERIEACEKVGLAKQKLILDPGFGFGKSLAHNLTLINRLADFKTFELPILVGLSRKSTISKLLAQQNFNPSQEEVDIIDASVAGALLAIERGASIIRVHDVKQTVIALKVRQAIQLESIFE